MNGPAAETYPIEIREAIERAWLDGRHKSIERIEVIEEALAALVLGFEHDRLAAVSAAHKLAGTLGMFGLPEGSVLAREIERVLEGTLIEDDDINPLADLVVELRESIESAPDKPIAPEPVADRPSLQIIGADRSYVEAIKLGAEGRGFDASVITAVATFPDAGSAAVVVIDVAAVAVEMIPTRVDRSRDQLLVVVGASNDLSTRLALAEREPDLVIGNEVAPNRVIELIADELDSRRRTGRVTVVGPVPGTDGGLDSRIAGWTLARISVDDLFTASIEADAAVIVDASAVDPESVVHVCRSIRDSGRLRHLPVVVILSEEPRSGAVVDRLLAAGADDVTWAHGAALAERIHSRVVRQGGGARAASLQPAPESIISQVDVRLRAAEQGDQPLAVVFIAPSDLTGVNHREGRDAGDHVLNRVGHKLSSQFRSDDVVGRFGGGYVVLLDGDRSLAADRLDSLLAELQQSGLDAKGAIAVIGEDGADGNALVGLAVRRCQPSAAGGDGSDRAILLVEDDPLIAALVTDLLSSRGHRVQTVSDGLTAASMLVRRDVSDDFKLVVLDVSLPGLDGFGVLRQMERNRLAAPLPVVLVTARASETEVLAGLDLGAVDHVAKPFSPLVLLRRLERVLEL